MNAIPVARGCGTRVGGGIYAELGMGPDGRPVEDFLVDEPIVLDVEALGLSPVGVKLIERNGIWHIVDWIGSQHYPNVTDFVEEVRRFGLSRRLAKTLDFSKLTFESRILAMHARAWVENFHLYADKWQYGESDLRCPKHKADHDLPDYPLCCVGVYWQDVSGGDPQDRHREVRRNMPSFSYTAYERPQNVYPEYQPAIFASFPISRIAVIADTEGQTHNDAMKAAQRSKLPVELESE